MWIFSKYGFFSVVKKRDESSGKLRFHIRARRRGDLENLVELELDDRNRTALITSRRRLKIVDTPAGDYCSRLIVDAWNWARVSTLLMVSIDYDNFKNEIAGTPDQHDKLAAYHDVWHRLFEYQQGRRPMDDSGDAANFEYRELHADPRGEDIETAIRAIELEEGIAYGTLDRDDPIVLSDAAMKLQEWRSERIASNGSLPTCDCPYIVSEARRTRND